MNPIKPTVEEEAVWSTLIPKPLKPQFATPHGKLPEVQTETSSQQQASQSSQVVQLPPVGSASQTIQQAPSAAAIAAAASSLGAVYPLWVDYNSLVDPQTAGEGNHLLERGLLPGFIEICRKYGLPPKLTLEETEALIAKYESTPIVDTLEAITDRSRHSRPPFRELVDCFTVLCGVRLRQRGLDHLFKMVDMNQTKNNHENPKPVTTFEQKPDMEEVGLKVIVWIAQGMFMDRNTSPESTYEHALKTGKKLLRASARHDNKVMRQLLGENYDIWDAYAELLSVALPSLESQSFSPEDPNASSAALIAANYTVLMKDLERVNDLLLIARNILATTSLAQDIAGDSGIVQHVIKLIEICVRVTARGYDGEAGARINEAQWRNIIDAYKKLLITCLQLIHNLVQQNEKRKLLLWLDLFANSRSPGHYFSANGTVRKDGSTASDGAQNGDLLTAPTSQKSKTPEFAGDILVTNAIELVQRARKIGSQETREMHPDEAARLASQVMDTVEGMVSMTLEQNRRDAIMGGTTLKNSAPDASYDAAAAASDRNQSWSSLPDLALNADLRGNGAIKPEDMKCLRTPQSAAIVLQQAKDQLMARLQDPPSGIDEDGEQRAYVTATGNGEDGASDIAAESIENNDDEDDYRSSDQERGLMTDIPLVLGPQEIEALPMIIQGGIVPSLATKGKNGKDNADMQSVRCNILLAQEAGRNLLRELLIFIAAWDLPEEELYFKLMIQIMEAILANGLMPFAYQAFGEVKDIVSPAQSMVIKILTQIFRTKQGMLMNNRGTAANTTQRRDPPTRVDLLIIRYVFTVFRQCIIPETCALIYLQGQIRAGAALPEDFPLNLWDMERVYEGVYQFLEFFAVLTESEDWKALLVNWEIVSELVTLLRELDASIPKSPLGPIPSAAAATEALGSASSAMQEPQLTAESSLPAPAPAPVAVERPYDSLPTNDLLAGTAPASNGTLPQTSAFPSEPASPSPSQAIDSQDPSDFEWRNLKKLVVLVLSSLVWKSPTVQNQIRAYGGVEMILACCNFDANNPYIREHAIMCLRFLLEGNAENQSIVENLKPKGADVGPDGSDGDGDDDGVMRAGAVKDALQTFGEETEKMAQVVKGKL
ncbi:MAG: hypothetical protein Q9181_000883 [Wetmoreana brouardii]